ncbi:MAG: IS110 family transposase [Pseudomonadota bacterium]|nr:IS110 family transposase [Pseudomonadota bacterium]
MVNSSSLGVITIGIDVSKEKLDVCVLPLKLHFVIENTAKGIRQLLPKLPNSQSTAMVVLEATNRYEKCARDILMAHGYRVHIGHPSRVYYFGRSEKGYAKTDKIDSKMLAEYAKKDSLQPSAVPDKQIELLEELSARRGQLVAMKSAESSRMSGNLEPAVKRSIKRFMKSIDNEIEQINQELKKNMEQREDLVARKALLSSCKGIGDVASTILVSCLPELGFLTRTQISALTGLAPYNADSGTKKGVRKIRGGRSYIRSILYMCCLSAVRFNPTLREYYQQLIARGKIKRVAQVAVMRKMIIMLNAMARENKAWDPNYTSQPMLAS